MYDYTAEVIAVMACLLTLVTVWYYERHAKALRYERDEAIADAELFSQLLIDAGQHRHPSTAGSNVRVLRVVE